ncbi:hypothetical protein SpCBS45565_g06993 [Spizellomyces sp. 'palustris']|nr:hypothetical protein SpCBS45565_g06993 [Spizellomyces sp. 'palustris']
MFKKLTTNFAPQRGGPLSPDRAAEILHKAASLVDQTSFEWIIVDKPVDGSIFVFQLHPSEPLPEDGYGWMDDEAAFRTIVVDKEMEIISRSQGFGYGDKVAHMTRRRYRLVHSDLQLMHYLQMPDPARHVPVHPQLIKAPPRDPATLPNLTARGPPPPQMVPPYGMAQRGMAGADPAHYKHLAHRKRGRMKPSMQPRAFLEDDHDPSGDELDGSVSRAVALERYKRNHEFIDMIFSPYPIASIIPPQVISDTSADRLEALKRQQVEVGEEMGKLAQSNADEIKEFQEKSKKLCKGIDVIKHAKSLQELDALEAGATAEL